MTVSRVHPRSAKRAANSQPHSHPWLDPLLRPAWLRGDLVAGVTVAALIVPKNLGYAGIAGVPLQNGLYAAAAAAILYAIFGTSRQLSVGPSSGLAAVAASAVLAAGLTSEQDVASFVAGITLASGVLYLLLAVLRMGWIAQFLSRAVVTGFLFGAAIDVVIGELPKLTGTKVSGSNSFQELWSWLGPLSDPPGDGLGRRLSLLVVFGLGESPRAFRALWCWSSAGCWHRGCSTSASAAWRSSVPCPGGCPRSNFRT